MVVELVTVSRVREVLLHHLYILCYSTLRVEVLRLFFPLFSIIVEPGFSKYGVEAKVIVQVLVHVVCDSLNLDQVVLKVRNSHLKGLLLL